MSIEKSENQNLIIKNKKYIFDMMVMYQIYLPLYYDFYEF